MHSSPLHRLLRVTTACALLGGASVHAQFATPGPEHLAMKKHEGEWTAKVKTEGGDSAGTMTVKMECGGLWLSSDFKSDFGGLPFHGRGLDTYDPGKKKYLSVWVDSMSTRPLILEGTLHEPTKTLTLRGEGVGPDGGPAKYKTETIFTDDQHHLFHMYLVAADGTETKMMTIEYTRKK